MTTNQIALRDVKAKEKANQIRELELAETSAHNRNTERYTEEHYIKQDQAALTQAWAASSQAATAEKNQIVNAINAQTNAYNAETSRLVYAENVQHNRKTEEQRDTELSQRTTELIERERHNRQEEAIGYMNAAANDLKATTEAGNAVRNALYDSSVLKFKTSEQLQSAYEFEQTMALERDKFERSKAESDKKAMQYDTELAIKAAGTELKGLELQYKYSKDHEPNVPKLAEWIIDPLKDFTDKVFDKLKYGAIY